MAKEAIIAAAIDIGTNSFRLLVAEIIRGKLRPLVKELATVRLGKGLTNSGFLGPDSMEYGLEVLSTFADHIASYNPVFCRACGTAALRRAANRDDFLQKAASFLGTGVEIISGEEEALLTCLGVVSRIDSHAAGPMLIVDVGGGSTELAWTDELSEHPRVNSLFLGAVGLTEDFLHERLSADIELSRLRQHIRKKLSDGLPAADYGNLSVIGSGGTATTLAALHLDLKEYDDKLVHGHLLNTCQLSDLYSRLSMLTPEQRNILPGLEHGRGDIILAGTMIYQELLELVSSRYMQVSDAGLLEGILLDKIRG